MALQVPLIEDRWQPPQEELPFLLLEGQKASSTQSERQASAAVPSEAAKFEGADQQHGTKAVAESATASVAVDGRLDTVCSSLVHLLLQRRIVLHRLSTLLSRLLLIEVSKAQNLFITKPLASLRTCCPCYAQVQKVYVLAVSITRSSTK
jgi:hypothetical protein